MNKSKPNTIFIILSFIYLAHNIMPIIGALPSMVYGGIFLVLYIFTTPIWIKPNISIFSLFLIDILLLFLKLINNEQCGLYIYGILQQLLNVYLILYFVKYYNNKFLKKYLYIILFMYLITCVTTIIGNIIFPNSSRILATLNNDSEFNKYSLYNIGGFSFIYRITLICPLLIGLIHTKRINYLFGIICLSIIGITVYFSHYTTALMMYVLITCLFFINKINKNKYNKLLLCLILIFVFGKILIIGLLNYSLKFVNDDMYKTKINYTISYLDNQEFTGKDISGDRISLYKYSIDVFNNNILIGAWQKNAGGHSYIFDNLAMFGCLGMLCMFIGFFYFYKLIIKPFKNSPLYYYLLFVFNITLIYTIINPKNFIISLIVIMLPLNVLILESSKSLNMEN